MQSARATHVRSLWLVVAMSLATPAAALAQRLPPLIGSRVRIQADSGPRLAGVVIRQSTDSLTFLADDSVVTLSSDEARILHMKRQVTRRSASYALGGLLIGGAFGLLAGVVDGRHSVAQCQAAPGENDLCGLGMIAVPILTVGGAFLGAIVGALTKAPHWDPLL